MQISTRELTLGAVISDNMIDGVEVIFGMDMIDALGGVVVQFDELEGGMVSTSSLLTETDKSLDKKL